MGLTFILAGAYVAPRGRFITSLILFVLVVMLAGFVPYATFLGRKFEGSVWISMVAVLLGAGGAVYQFHEQGDGPLSSNF
jgi:hypothetical protein